MALLAGFLLLGWPVTLLACVLPFAAFLAALERGPRRLAAVLPAAAVPALLLLVVPGSAFFVVAAVLAAGSVVAALGAGRRIGYPELSLCALAGLAGAALGWAVVEPAFFGRLAATLEAATLQAGRVWIAWAERSGGLDATARAAIEAAVASSAAWSARAWPSAAFGLLWLGSGVGLAFAERAARGRGHAARVRVAERCAAFKLPEVWVWIFLAGVSVFLLTPGANAAAGARDWVGSLHEAALNVALVSAGLFAWQGLAVALYYLERRAVRPVLRVLLVASGLVLLPRLVLVVALGLGLVDVRLDLRSRGGGRPPPATPA